MQFVHLKIGKKFLKIANFSNLAFSGGPHPVMVQRIGGLTLEPNREYSCVPRL